jgi:hypothetical protein
MYKYISSSSYFVYLLFLARISEKKMAALIITLASCSALPAPHQIETSLPYIVPVFRIRIHRIHIYLGLPDPDPSKIMQK